ncbi:MAG: hypothetical protein QF619_10820 [Candidatus Binatia bacterium]|nr:hypothetical protein [Candidatus Binatia bacterium]
MSQEIEQKFREMLLRRTGKERMKMGCTMHATAQTLVRASLLIKDPMVSSAPLRRPFFLLFYGREFDSETRAKILQALDEA